jgi:nitrite reductase/ring-hydroxylating ferredoxin subunit
MADDEQGTADDEQGWVPVLSSGELAEGTPVRVALEGLDVFLYRAADRIYALDDRCSHQGGPLHRGRVDAAISPPTVTCPIHGSMFLMTDGRVMRGPALRAQPVFDVRESDGMIEIRDREG